MALNAYMYNIKGKKQNDIKGSITQKGREGWIEIIAANHQIVSPRDPASGLATGKRMHKPYTVTAPYDKALPLLYSALVNNETIVQVEFVFFSPTKLGERGSGQGVEEATYKVRLENAHLSDIQFRMPNNKNPDLMKYENYVEYSFTYQKIIGTWVNGGITWEDDWEAPLQNFS
jgi:type VI secretion system secreted protein Hcp